MAIPRGVFSSAFSDTLSGALGGITPYAQAELELLTQNQIKAQAPRPRVITTSDALTHRAFLEQNLDISSLADLTVAGSRSVFLGPLPETALEELQQELQREVDKWLTTIPRAT